MPYVKAKGVKSRTKKGRKKPQAREKEGREGGKFKRKNEEKETDERKRNV